MGLFFLTYFFFENNYKKKKNYWIKKNFCVKQKNGKILIINYIRIYSLYIKLFNK